MTWNVLVQSPRAGDPVIVVASYQKKEDAEHRARLVSRQYRFAGEHRPTVYLQKQDSADQLQTFQNGTRAVRDQPTLPARGQDVVIIVPPATGLATAPLPRGGS